MILLRFKAEFETSTDPFIAKLEVGPSGHTTSTLRDHHAVATPRRGHPGTWDCRSRHGAFVLHTTAGETIDGDVLMCIPSSNVVERLFRRGSHHNSLLLTERCDQLCVMCSQPPRDIADAWRLPLYEEAIALSDPGTLVGISGGEPTLYKEELLGMIDRLADRRTDLSYHVLTNGQHFAVDDHERLKRLHRRASIVWGIPLYSQHEGTHDRIVDKAGAFGQVLDNLYLLGSANARIELRTVITSLNVFDLPGLAGFVAKHIPFVSDWAVMGMEPMGYALRNWDRLFFDHSAFARPITNALEIADLRGLRCHLYNVPRCTIPERYRSHCVDSISDWKKKYLPECGSCSEKNLCCGFFEWYGPKFEWSQITPIPSGGGRG